MAAAGSRDRRSGGTSTSGNSPGGSTSSAGTATPSGYFQLKDIGYGKCLSVTYGVVFATCSDRPAANWTTKAGTSGSYKLYNESTGQCLSVNINQLHGRLRIRERPELAHGYQPNPREPVQQPVSRRELHLAGPLVLRADEVDTALVENLTAATGISRCTVGCIQL